MFSDVPIQMPMEPRRASKTHHVKRVTVYAASWASDPMLRLMCNMGNIAQKLGSPRGLLCGKVGEYSPLPKPAVTHPPPPRTLRGRILPERSSNFWLAEFHSLANSFLCFGRSYQDMSKH